MIKTSNDLNQAFTEVSRSSAGGAPFLIAYGVTFIITAILSFFLSKPATALIAMFQGGAALPLAFWLERKLGSGEMAADNPLRQLSVLLAVSQALGLPVLILVYSLDPLYIPLALASLGGVHFLPYAWLHRTRIYTAFAVSISMGSFALQLGLQAKAFSYILVLVAVIFWVSAPLVYKHAARIVNETV